MGKQITGKRIAAFIFAVVMTVAFMPILGTGEAAAAAKPKGRLVKTVTKQYYDKGTKSWEKDSVYTYKYNKHKDPSVITKKSYSESGNLIDTEKWTEKYTYKSGKRAKRTEKWNYDNPGDVTKWTYDKYGNPKSLYSVSGSLTRTTKCSFSKYGYIRTETIKDVSEDDGTDIVKYRYRTSMKNGLATKMIGYYYSEDGWKKDFAYKFNKKGLVTKYSTSGGAYYHPVKYTYKNGRVRSATVTFYGDPYNIVKERYIFTYTKKPVKKKRYSKMINHIIEGGNEFAWY